MNKRVGILTMQRVVNYGSFLQAYALKTMIESLGAECYFIDIENGRQLPGNEIDLSLKEKSKKIVNSVFKILTHTKQTFLVRKCHKEIRQNLIEYQNRILKLNKTYEDQFDLVVIGSDEVFNCTQRCLFGFSKQLFGQGLNTKQVISYAASFGFTTLEDLEKYGLSHEISNYLKSFSAISVRDDNSLYVVNTLTKIVPEMHLDPVLIHGFSSDGQENGNVELEDFIVIYTYWNRLDDPDEIASVCNFARKYKKKIVSIFCAYWWCDQYVIPDTPLDVIRYFKHADFIITDTFHGTIFSIVSKSRFCTIIRKSNEQKLTSLLSHFSLTDRLLRNHRDLEFLLLSPVSYEACDKKIEEERVKALSYLQIHLN